MKNMESRELKITKEGNVNQGKRGMKNKERVE